MSDGAARWRCGDVVTRREISWDRPCLAVAVRVVEDSDDLLATYIQEGAPFAYEDEVTWPTPTGRHPWWPRPRWVGHGMLMLQRPGDAYAVWHFWSGPDRAFHCWYLNVQEPFRRTTIGYDTQDLELDVVMLGDLTWSLKDEEQLDEHVRTGRHSAATVERVRELGKEITAMLDARDFWWDLDLRHWRPPPSWAPPESVAEQWQSLPWTGGSAF